MTIGKRFTKQEVYDDINRYKINESNFIVEILDDGIPMHYSTIVNRLNEQDKTITRLKKENEQLKKLLECSREEANDYCEELMGKDEFLRLYKEENEQLKNELRIYRKLANCSNCQYHNYDTLFGGDDEYEVCDKGNDVTDGICKDWREL